MSKETADILEGAAYLIPALVVIFIAAKVLAAFTNRRFAQALAPLLPVIAGTLRKDGLRGQIFGTHEGRPVAVEVMEGVRDRRFPGHPNEKRTLWRIELNAAGGALDWTFDRRGLRTFSPGSFAPTAEEAACAATLESSGAIAAIQSLAGEFFIAYSARLKRFSFVEDIRPALAPSPERFRGQLELLETLRRLTAETGSGLTFPQT